MQLKKTLLTLGITVATMLVPSLVYGQAYGKVNVETLNVRQQPNTQATNIGQLHQKDEVQIIRQADAKWLEIKDQNGKVAYIFGEYVSIEEADGIMIGDGVRLRDYPSTKNSNVLGSLNTGEKVVIQYTVDGWCKVIYNGKEGFVSAEYIQSEFMNQLPKKTIAEIERIDPSKSEGVTQIESTAAQNQTASSIVTNTKPIESTEGLADAIIEDAKQFLGNPYVYGGTSLTNGVDCSGFTQQIMKRHGISLSRTSGSQYMNDGYSVTRDELRKGDLVFFGYDGVISHVGIYIEDGRLIHSGTSSTGITISTIEEIGKPYIGAKRVL